jgi:two-component sensor histidine kinase
MLNLYDRLQRSGKYDRISIAEYLPDLVDEVVKGFPNRDAVVVEKRIEDCEMGIKEILLVGLIVNEAITNAMKYAFRNGGHLLITAAKSGDGIEFVVEDDGPGMPDPKAHTQGFGLTLIENLSQQLGGEAQIDGVGRTRISFFAKA